MLEAQALEVTQGVLEEIGAGPVPRLMLFNKADRIDPATKAELEKNHPDAVVLSAHAPEDVAALRQRLIDSFETSMVEGELVIPYAKQAVVSQVYENARVVSETFDEAGRRMVVRALPGAMARLTRLVSG